MSFGTGDPVSLAIPWNPRLLRPSRPARLRRHLPVGGRKRRDPFHRQPLVHPGEIQEEGPRDPENAALGGATGSFPDGGALLAARPVSLPEAVERGDDRSAIAAAGR